jgi:hypothetical protein
MSGGIEEIGPLPGTAKLTGNRVGELWGLFWTLTPPSISQIEKSSGASLVDVPVPDFPNNSTFPGASINPYGPAVAYWADALYVFLELSPQDTSTTVYKVLPSGVVTTHISGTGLHVLSAGVSSCAPAP